MAFHSVCVTMGTTYILICMQIAYFKKQLLFSERGVANTWKVFCHSWKQSLAGITPVALFLPRGFLIRCKASSSR